MGDQPASHASARNGEALARTVVDMAARSQRLVTDFLARQAAGGGPDDPDPLNIGGAFVELTTRLMADPAAMFQAQASLWTDYLALWQSTARRMSGAAAAPAAEPDAGDRRFADAAWSENQVFDFIKQSYLLTARWMQATVRRVDGIDTERARKLDFYTRQFVDALSPTNFAMTNPEVLSATVTSGGENLVRGLANLLADLERGRGRLDITMSDAAAFEIGRDVAATPGQVVLRTDLLELIQYSPTTETVRRRPLFIVTPWINKYYVLDLRPENSFIRWAVAQGHTVFVTSWVNPDAGLAAKTFDDYLLEGTMAGIDAICEITGEPRINLLGYCIGGTLSACTLAYMAARGDGRAQSATFFASLVDFAEPGELGVFIDEKQISALEASMNERGYLEGREMASSFNMMRDNDLIWSFVVHNYLLGRDPIPFDLLYWNADSTRMPAAMHGFYLRKMYLENKLVQPDGISLAGVPIDLRRIEVPAYILSTREDHIALWGSTFAATGLFSGPKRFVLAASGHIAGIVNPPSPKSRYGHWTGPLRAKMTPEAWLAGARRRDGSWWPDWDRWVKRHSGGETAARVPGAGPLPALGEAPGSYVRVRSD